jgi:protein arginine kinase activator
MSHSLCQICHERAASVFVTKVIKGHTHKQRLCEVCASERVGNSEFFADLPDEVAQAFDGGSIEEIVSNLLDQHFTADEWEESDPFAGEFPGDEELVDEMDERANEDDGEDEDDSDWQPFEAFPPSPQVVSQRCPRCETTWDRLRQDGRAGCPYCYTAFAEELRGVMGRLQRGGEHAGKRPRAAEKRRRRLEHLRVQRDNRLALLQKRLRAAIAAERYEEAAGLRDKIKMVTSTYVGDLTVPELP